MNKKSSPLCCAGDCQELSHARGMCRKHYERWRIHGSPDVCLVKQAPRGKLMDWVERHFQCASDECLIWPYTTNGEGYGLIRISGKNHIVSRIMCEKQNGPPPSARHQAAHVCGNGHTKCVNPRHLVWKTPKENQADRKVHGTLLVGEANASAKLTEDEVRAILASPNTPRKQLADKFGVSKNHITTLRKRRAWAHL